MPQNPKRKQSRQPADMLLDDGEVLRADDPRPQHVPQYPSPGTARRVPRRNEEAIPTSVYDTERHDEELAATYDGATMDQSFKPAFLYVERGPGAGQLVQVRQGVMVIGRASVADLRLQHPSISRRHAQLTRRGDKFYVKDLASQNGTFVNKARVDAEVEIGTGDTVALGSALLKLRGPTARISEPPTGKYAAQRERAEKVRHVPTAVVTRPGKAAGAMKIALFAGAVGFGLAVVVVFGLMRVPAPGFGSGKSGDAVKAAPGAVAPRAATRRFQAEPATDEIEISAGPTTIMAKRIDDAIEKKMAEQQKVQPPPAAAEAPRAAAPQPSSEAVAARKVQPKSGAPRAAAQEEADEAPARGAPRKAELLAAYEKGDAETSLAAAEQAGDKALAAQLQKFVDTYGAAEAAVEQNDARTAISKYEAALKLDDQISSGWSKYGADIRKKLAGIYVLAGSSFMEAGQDGNAKQAFQAALKHEPANAKAKSALAQLGGGEAPEAAAAPAKKASSRRSAADDAFDDDGADAKPAKATRKPAKAATRSAIDDAFGD